MPSDNTEQISNNVNTASRPSELKITDMRLVKTRVGGPILRLDTNQGTKWVNAVVAGDRPDARRPPELLTRDEGRAGPEEGVKDDIPGAAAVRDGPRKQLHGLHGRVEL